MLERDRRPQLISVVDVVGVDGLPPPLPRSQYVFAAVWAADAEVAAVYGASSSWSEELFVADFEAVLYHGGFFADLATRLRELAKACRAHGYYVLRRGRSSDISSRTGSWPSKSHPGPIRPKPCFSPPRASRAAGSSFVRHDRQDGDPPLGRGVELQGRRSGQGGAARRVLSRDFLEVRSPAFVQAQTEALSQRSVSTWPAGSSRAC